MADRDEVLAKLAHLRRRAYKPVLEPGDGVATDSKLGGTPYVPEGADWPRCEQCSEHLGLIVQLNPAQFPEPLRKAYGTDLLQLLYCGNCRTTIARQTAVAGDPASPPRRAGDEREAVIRGWTAVDDYPDPGERAALGVELEVGETAIAEGLTEPGTKLSGWPTWSGDVAYPPCPECGKAMRLVVQLEGGGRARGHLTQCPEHKRALAFE